MSGTTNSNFDDLRRNFAIWSLAIFGSLTGSGSVRLESTVWGAEDPPTEAKATKEKSQAGVFDRAAFQQAVQAKDFEAAAALLDPELVKDPTGMNVYYNFMLANAMVNAKEPAGDKRMEEVAKQSLEALANTPTPPVYSAFAMSQQAMATRLLNQQKADEAIQLIESAIAKLEEQKAGSQTSSLNSTLMSLLMRAGRTEEAKSRAIGRLDKVIETAKENNTASTRSAVSMAFSQFTSLVGSKFPEEMQKAYATVEPMLREAAEGDNSSVGDYSVYQSVQTSYAMAIAESDPKIATEVLDSTKALAEKLAERLDEAEQKRLTTAQMSLKSAESRLKSKLLHASLIGQPAPDFDVEAVVNMSKVSMADLKGKVVLIDFWAVWCGPCIATFPHLQEWKKQYGDKGLVIVGVTRQYGYKWDKEANKHVADKEASLEVELDMLEEFRKAHQLEHGFVVTPKGSDYNSKFGVTGIPQAVLVDQNGVIQLIKVGSGEKNAEELEEKIKSLLGV